MNPSTATSQPRTISRRRTLVAAFAVAPVLVLVAACGGSSSGGSGSTPAAAAPSPTRTGGTGQARTFPGASGLIAAASPGVLQVQSTTAQNTVTYTAATAFTETTTGTIGAGDCVVVTGTPGASPDGDHGPLGPDRREGERRLPDGCRWVRWRRGWRRRRRRRRFPAS